MAEPPLCTAFDWQMRWQIQALRHSTQCCRNIPTQQQGVQTMLRCLSLPRCNLCGLTAVPVQAFQSLAPPCRWAQAIVLLAKEDMQSPPKAAVLDALTAFAPAIRHHVIERNTDLVYTLTVALTRCNPSHTLSASHDNDVT